MTEFKSGNPSHPSTSDNMEKNSGLYVHTVSEACRLLPSASRWNSIELEFNLLPTSLISDNTPSNYSKSIDYNLIISNKKHFKRFIYISVSLVFVIVAIVLLLHFLPLKHAPQDSSKNLTVPLNQALLFFDAQKSGVLPNNLIKFRGDSGLEDGNFGDTHVDLVGGFYDSGNNIKFTFPTAYTVTLLSWTVIEYHQKYADIGELEHIKDIIKWGSDYLLKVFVPSNSTSDPTILYSQVGSTNNSTKIDNDINCWQRPEDMTYQRPVSICRTNSSDLAGEIIAALSATSLVFKDDKAYSIELIKAAEKLFELVIRDPNKQGTYTMDDDCGGEARKFYNSSGYLDEVVWGGSWLFFATGNNSYLRYATEKFELAVNEELTLEKGVFSWNNKLAASAVLLTRLRYFRDPGYPYEETLEPSSNMTDLLMCSYLSHQSFNKTPGGLILLRPDLNAPLQYAAAASFLSKLYSDYLYIMQSSGRSCSTSSFSIEMLHKFSIAQASIFKRNNPMKMSYLVGFGDHFPTQVHHRGASISWDNRRYSCPEGNRWLYSKDPNPNVLIGSMVAGPTQDDNFSNARDKPEYTEPSISGNAALVAALIALHDPPRDSSSLKGFNGGIDKLGIFSNIRVK
ncbi:Glycoside hydrolase [Macleaya cordata]|uniref:cellulase n=1 Tax=Macleaya cordata TaxID=56857 RepID=A0A200PZ67_MACCD|nr:Glycoside hydrolase [Macleaya cordata]